MGRRIVSSQLESNAKARELDTYFDRVTKLIQSEIVAAWLFVSSMITNAADVPTTRLLWIAFGMGLLLTLLWIFRETSEPGKGKIFIQAPVSTGATQSPARRLPRPSQAFIQALVSTGAFACWVFALGGPFATLSFYKPLYGSLVLIAYTLFAGLPVPPED